MYGSLFRHHLSPKHLGRRKAKRGTWNQEEKGRGASLALASLNWGQMGPLPHPPRSCHVKHLRALTHLESWKGTGRAGFYSFPSSLPLCRFSGDGAVKEFPGLTLGHAVHNRSSLWRQFMFYSAVLTFTSSSRVPTLLQGFTYFDTLLRGLASFHLRAVLS